MMALLTSPASFENIFFVRYIRLLRSVIVNCPCPLCSQHQIRFPVPQTATLINYCRALFNGDGSRYGAALRSVALTVTAFTLSQVLVQLTSIGFISLNILVNPLMADRTSNAPANGADICSGPHFQPRPTST